MGIIDRVSRFRRSDDGNASVPVSPELQCRTPARLPFGCRHFPRHEVDDEEVTIALDPFFASFDVLDGLTAKRSDRVLPELLSNHSSTLTSSIGCIAVIRAEAASVGCNLDTRWLPRMSGTGMVRLPPLQVSGMFLHHELRNI
jgi:hypothetical protein